MSKKQPDKVNAYASLIRKGYGVHEDESSALEASTLKSKIRPSNNGHKTFTIPQQDFLKEIYVSEMASQDKFLSSAASLTRARNPILGDETEREDREFRPLISPSTLKNLTFMEQESPENRGTPPENRKNAADVEKVDALRRRRDMIEVELKQLSKVLAHRKTCLGMTYHGDGPRVLHPAMEQTSLGAKK